MFTYFKATYKNNDAQLSFENVRDCAHVAKDSAEGCWLPGNTANPAMVDKIAGMFGGRNFQITHTPKSRAVYVRIPA